METKELYAALGISPEVYEYGEKICAGLRDRFEAIDRVAEYNQAKVLLAVEDPATQEFLCDLIVKGGLSVRQLEEKVKSLEKEPSPAKKKEDPGTLPEMYYRLLENVGKYFGENISLRRSREGKGVLTIKFESDAQMEEFMKALDQR